MKKEELLQKYKDLFNKSDINRPPFTISYQEGYDFISKSYDLGKQAGKEEAVKSLFKQIFGYNEISSEAMSILNKIFEDYASNNNIKLE